MSLIGTTVNGLRCKLTPSSNAAITLSSLNQSSLTINNMWVQGPNLEGHRYFIKHQPWMSNGLNRIEISDCQTDNCSRILDMPQQLSHLVIDSSTFNMSTGEDDDVPGYFSSLFIRAYSNNIAIQNSIVNADANGTVQCGSHLSGSILTLRNNTISNSWFDCNRLEDNSNVLFEANRCYDSYLEFYKMSTRVLKNQFILSPNNTAISKSIIYEPYTGYVGCTNEISGNTFINVPTPIDIGGTSLDDTSNSVINNSFFDCDRVCTIFNNGHGSNNIDRYVNNLFHGDSTNPFNVVGPGGQPSIIPEESCIPVSHSHFSTALSPNPSLIVDNASMVYGDPKVNIDSNTYDYSLIWDNTAKSPLINAGCPEIDGVPQYDPDGTPPDIGAVYYPHHSRTYFSGVSPSNIYWLSFPVVDDRTNTNGDYYWNELGQMFSEYMQGPPDNPSILNHISWSYDVIASTMQYDWDHSVWGDTYHPVTQPKGYKVQFASGIHPDELTINGFKANPNTTPVAWAVRDAQNQPFQNWVGYFATFTQGAGDALSRYLPGSTRFRYIDYVHTIKTQTWSTCRMSEEFGSPWVINPNTYTVSEGDMMILLLFPDAPEEMYWLSPSSSKPPIEKPRATAFEYTEKLDYTPVYLEFDPAEMPSEVGLFVNGVCRGAAVVDSTMIDICLYDAEAKDSGELEIIFYHEGKGKKAAKGWKYYNPERMVFEGTELRTDQIGRYAYLSFTDKEGDSPVPLITCLSQNYPNPFNPETNISFVLANDMQTRLDIYNIRGQKITTLFNGEMAKGKHTLQWNGTDAQSRKVASGIYFSRLTTPEGSFSQKMMLMK
ncbi:MAG: T9SS type A sorting domain-containing protein [Syntrophaceticus schinkii]|nr:T9SS type A sorting domain-containing protein [Syntrophaceticus schinkii]